MTAAQGYDVANQLLTATALLGITTYSYDLAGNRRTVETPSGDVTTHTFDALNHNTHVELPDGAEVFTKWAPVNKASDDRQIERDDGVEVRPYVWDDQAILQEVDGTNTVLAQNTVVPGGYGQLISRTEDGLTSTYQFDALGSTRSLTDPSGTITDEYSYEAFGKLLDSTGSTDNPYQWIGQQGYRQETTTGEYNLRARDYDPQAARFTSNDPLGLSAGDSNFYRYVSNDPVNKSDPGGLDPLEQLTLADRAELRSQIGGSSLLLQMAMNGDYPIQYSPGGYYYILFPDGREELVKGPVLTREQAQNKVDRVERNVETIKDAQRQNVNQELFLYSTCWVPAVSESTSNRIGAAGGLVLSAVEAVAAAGCIIATEPVVTKVGGACLATIAADQCRTSAYTLWTGEGCQTALNYAGTKAALTAGCTPEQSQWVGAAADIAPGILAGRIVKPKSAGCPHADGTGTPPASAKVVAPNSVRGGTYGHLEDGPKVGSGKPFTAAQKKLILRENQSMNGGQLLDDVTGEVGQAPVKHQKGITPPYNEVHVDHYYPKSEGGPNTFSNAELRLRKYNLKKSNQIPGE